MKGESMVRDPSLTKAFLEGASSRSEDAVTWLVSVHRKGRRVFVGGGYTSPQTAFEAAILRVVAGEEGYDIHIKQVSGHPEALLDTSGEHPEVEVVGVEPSA